MGYDAGFDLYPPLKNTESDNELYASFHTSGVQHYLNEIAAIARTYFGDSRVHWWNESHERHGPYSWTEVYAAERSNPPADHRMYF